MFPQIWYHSFKTYTCLVRSIWLKWLWTWLACEAILCQLVRNLREGKQGISRISGCFVCLHARMVDAGVTVSWGLGKQRSYRHKWHTSIQGFFSSINVQWFCNFMQFPRWLASISNPTKLGIFKSSHLSIRKPFATQPQLYSATTFLKLVSTSLQ